MTDKFLPYGIHSIDENDIEEVVKVLKSDWVTGGPKVEEFEQNITKYVGAKHAVGVNSGTSALDIAVSSLEPEPGSEIITTPFTFAATGNSILFNNCVPVFADIDGKTYNIDPAQIEKKITQRTKAIIYVDYAGQPCEIDEIKDIAKKHNLFLIEDAAHALGAEYKGKRVGTFADMTIFSFHPVKHITTGEGGMVVTDNSDFFKKLKSLRNHGMDRSAKDRLGTSAGYSYDIKKISRNYRITDIQCALGISQLKKLETFLKKREELVKMYNDKLSRLPEITTPYVKPHIRHAWHLYTILLNKKIGRDKFFEKMRAQNIGVNVHYIPTYKFSAYKRFNINPQDFPVTEEIFSRIITLPLHPRMSEDDVSRVVDAIKDGLRKSQ